MLNTDLQTVILFIISIVSAIIITYFLTKNHFKNSQNNSTILPLKLQAFERMVLFLERITPSNLLVREPGNDLNALSYQQFLLATVRQEFNHNLAQQIYISQPTWAVITKSMNQIVSLINQSAKDLNHQNTSKELARAILENTLQQKNTPTAFALQILKDEIESVMS